MKRFVILLIVVCMASFIFAAGTVTETDVLWESIKRIDIAWLTATNGTGATATIKNFPAGEIKKVIFTSDTGSVNPTTAYDITLLDAAGSDILSGLGANIATNTIKVVCPGVKIVAPSTSGTNVVPMVIMTPLSLVVTNAGAGKSGDITIYIR